MLKQLFSIISVSLFVATVNAQTLKAFEKAADKAFAAKDYYSAMVHLSEALAIEPESPHLQFKYAEVCRQFNAYDLAAEYYQKVIEQKNNPFREAHFWLGKMYKNILSSYMGECTPEELVTNTSFTRPSKPSLIHGNLWRRSSPSMAHHVGDQLSDST